MACIEQQADGRAGRGHEGVDIGLALDDGPHVVVVDQIEALGFQQVGKAGHAGA
jgi:hypothetical protein